MFQYVQNWICFLFFLPPWICSLSCISHLPTKVFVVTSRATPSPTKVSTHLSARSLTILHHLFNWLIYFYATTADLVRYLWGTIRTFLILYSSKIKSNYPWNSLAFQVICRIHLNSLAIASKLFMYPLACLSSLLPFHCPHSNHAEGLDFSLTSMSVFAFVIPVFSKNCLPRELICL